jgi:hypothetical protein
MATDFEIASWIAMTFVIVSGVGGLYAMHLWQNRPIIDTEEE